MKRKPNLAKVKALAAVTKKIGGAFVFATRDANLPNVENVSAEIAQYPFAEVACKSCDAHFHAVHAKGLQVHCSVCGHEHVELVKADSEPVIAADKDLTFLTCAGCGTHNIFHHEVASIGDALHCSACGTGMKTAADLDAAPPVVDVPVEDVDDMDLLDLDDTEIAETTSDGVPNGTSADNPAPLPADPKVAPPNTTSDGVPSGTSSDKPAPMPADPVVTPNPDTTTQGPVPASVVSADTDEVMNNDYSDDEMTIDMVDTIDEDAALAFVYAGDKVSLVAQDRVIATLTAETAGDHAEFLQHESFRDSVAHTAATLGLKKAIAQYNFKPAKLTVKLQKSIARKVEAAVTSETAALDKKSKEYAEDFQQCLEIAAAGFINNQFRSKRDPLKDTLVREISATGMKQSSAVKLVNRVMASQAIPQLREILAIARDLAKKPVEARNALAEVLDVVRYQSLAADEGDEGDEDEDDASDEDIETVAHPVQTTASVSSQSRLYQTSALRNILGDEPMFNI